MCKNFEIKSGGIEAATDHWKAFVLPMHFSFGEQQGFRSNSGDAAAKYRLRLFLPMKLNLYLFLLLIICELCRRSGTVYHGVLRVY